MKKNVKNQLSVFVEFIPNCDQKKLSSFKFLNDINRDVKEPHVKKIAESFEEFGTASVVLTVVRTKSIKGKVEEYVADGQHRLLAAQRLNCPIHVIIVELTNDTKLNLTTYISTLNNTSSGWSPNTYLNSFLHNDLREYTIINELKSTTGLTMTDLMFIFLGSNNKKLFASGKMKFVNEADSMELLKAVMSVKTVIPNKAFVRRSLYKIMRLCKDYKRMAKAILVTAEALKTAHTSFSENEAEFFNHLVKIYKAEFNVKN
jgi:hypothetical protein